MITQSLKYKLNVFEKSKIKLTLISQIIIIIIIKLTFIWVKWVILC